MKYKTDFKFCTELDEYDPVFFLKNELISMIALSPVQLTYIDFWDFWVKNVCLMNNWSEILNMFQVFQFDEPRT